MTLGSIVTDYVLEAQGQGPGVRTVYIPQQLYRALMQKFAGDARGVTMLEWGTHMGRVLLVPQEEAE